MSILGTCVHCKDIPDDTFVDAEIEILSSAVPQNIDPKIPVRQRPCLYTGPDPFELAFQNFVQHDKTFLNQSGCPRGIEPAASTFTASYAIPLHHRHHQSSSPGWIRTSDLPHVTGMSCRWTTGPVPRPGFEPGTPRSKRGMMVHFTIGASSGRQGSRTLISCRRAALAKRSG